MAAQGPIILGIALRFVSAGASFLVTFLVARAFGAAVSGQFALFSQTVVMFGLIAVFGNDYLLVRRIAGFVATERLDLARLSFSHAQKGVAIGAALMAVLLLLLAPQAELVGVVPAIVVLAAVALPMQAWLNICSAAVRAVHRQVQSQGLQTLQPLIMLALTFAVLALWTGPPGIGLALAYIASLILAVIPAAAASHGIVRHWPVSDQRHPDSGKTNSIRLGLTVAIDIAVGWFAISITGALLGTAEMGVLRVCLQIVTVFAMIASTLEGIMAPRFAAQFGVGNRTAARQTLNRSIAFLLLVGGVPLALVIVFAEPILALMGEEFRIGGDALRILCLGQLAVLAAGGAGSMVNMAGREHVSLKLALLCFVLMIPALVLLTPRLGLVGPAIAIALTWLIRYQGSHLYARIALRPAA